MFWPRENWGESKKRKRGEGERRKGNACSQTPGIWKPPTCSVTPEHAHRGLKLSLGVINWPIKCFAFRWRKWPFADTCWTRFRNQHAYGGGISTSPSDQCRLCSCNFKVKFGNLSQTSYNYFNRKSIQSVAKEGLQGTSFSTNLPESWTWGG